MFVVVDGAKEHQARAEAATTGVSPTLRRHGACCARRPWGAIGRTISPFSVAAVRRLAGNAAPRLLRLERKQCALLQFPPALSQRGWCRRRRTGVLAVQAITVALRHHRRGATPCRQPPRAPIRTACLHAARSRPGRPGGHGSRRCPCATQTGSGHRPTSPHAAPVRARVRNVRCAGFVERLPTTKPPNGG
jgi:hypothetical protein